MQIKRILGALLATALPLSTLAQPRPTVVELYTSEGCSSCPPAESLIGTLASSRPDVIALAFHVDYWDDLGWKDRFEIPEATPRQRQYQHSLHLSSVYTPQLVIDGHQDTVGGSNPSLISSDKKEQTFPLEATVRAGQLIVSVGKNSVDTPLPNEVVLVSYLAQASSHITRGENAGRELREFNIVRSLKVLGSWSGDAQSFSVPLTSLPSDATAIVVLVQARGEGPIVGALTRALH